MMNLSLHQAAVERMLGDTSQSICLMSALSDTRGLLLHLQTNSLTTFIMTLTLLLTNSLTLIDILLLDDCLLDTTRYSLLADLYGIAPVHHPQFLQVKSLYP